MRKFTVLLIALNVLFAILSAGHLYASLLLVDTSSKEFVDRLDGLGMIWFFFWFSLCPAISVSMDADKKAMKKKGPQS